MILVTTLTPFVAGCSGPARPTARVGAETTRGEKPASTAPAAPADAAAVLHKGQKERPGLAPGAASSDAAVTRLFANLMDQQAPYSVTTETLVRLLGPVGVTITEVDGSDDKRKQDLRIFTCDCHDAFMHYFVSDVPSPWNGQWTIYRIIKSPLRDPHQALREAHTAYDKVGGRSDF